MKSLIKRKKNSQKTQHCSRTPFGENLASYQLLHLFLADIIQGDLPRQVHLPGIHKAGKGQTFSSGRRGNENKRACKA